jgi:hypothetical protein
LRALTARESGPPPAEPPPAGGNARCPVTSDLPLGNAADRALQERCPDRASSGECNRMARAVPRSGLRIHGCDLHLVVSVERAHRGGVSWSMTHRAFR